VSVPSLLGRIAGSFTPKERVAEMPGKLEDKRAGGEDGERIEGASPT